MDFLQEAKEWAELGAVTQDGITDYSTRDVAAVAQACALVSIAESLAKLAAAVNANDQLCVKAQTD